MSTAPLFPDLEVDGPMERPSVDLIPKRLDDLS
jgi:hypothetical protein